MKATCPGHVVSKRQNKHPNPDVLPAVNTTLFSFAKVAKKGREEGRCLLA